MHLLNHREVWQILILSVTGFLLGLIFGQPFLLVSVVLLIFLIRHFRNIKKFYQWLLNGDLTRIPESKGIWGDIFNELFIREKKSGGDRSRLTGMLNQFQEAAAVFPDGMLTLSRNNKIEWANPTACSLLGISFPEDFGQAISNLIRHPEFISYLDMDDHSREITIPSPEKNDRIITIQLIPFGEGKKLLIVRDITHVVKLEEMRTNFIGNVSHELRTPITVICGYLETLSDMENISAAQLKKPLLTMYLQAKRMDNLVRDLLALSKLETEPVTKERKIVDVPSMLVSIKESAQLLSGSREHELIFEIDEDLQILGKHEELHSLFSNLVNNAVRYTQAKGVIQVSWYLDKNDQPVFRVKDNGPGIAAEHIPHITERFYRVDADRSRETGGTGLGLAIVKHVLERHEGQLKVRSKLGQGTEFECIFPQSRKSFRDAELRKQYVTQLSH